MKLKLVFESHPYGNCYACPAYFGKYKNEIVLDCGKCTALDETIENFQQSEHCPAVLNQSDEIRAGEIAALKAEIMRLKALVRGEV